ncbi:serine O-acetyltransferase [Campylobacter sputorum subsp. bubulus]|uniref:Serine acetyltransferase n=1 Tax=Campylobacter sputorum subsp. sputorum TaxID=32024 RepID=A0A381DHX1_9BACT|nr:serine O-acetyltransferase [Campylobacter sputorum]ASM35321.1 serine O-acetyltransferase [Campylobacter sputorum aubsp. sputorum RM3237]ASM37002.1 serine O-acetyltransferase [Campylobacter sputorum bv. faecalis CCUG 20703]KAB0582934.1 serine O-acetyltransferase [Campylobacter sputorum subsp. sputorum]QEL05513.1 serine O-acetyltransferase [Campylobacter sputorum subsp. sputorum]SUX08668.1 serine O-acetyltransferase [Campylobacter sputorum subsp. bubulus]
MEFLNIIKEDFLEPKRQDPAFNSLLEIFFNYPGVWAIINHRFAHFFHTKGFKRLARVMAGISRFFTGVDIHPAAKVGRRVFLDHATGIVIGETAEIGNRVLLYQGVTLGGVSLDRGKRHPTLKEGVVVGAGAKILGNITIGKNSKIGANSVVVKNVPPNCTAVGIPATVLGGCDKTPLSHNKIPNINKELFEYIVKRISIIEEILQKDNEDILSKDKALEELYKKYIIKN